MRRWLCFAAVAALALAAGSPLLAEDKARNPFKVKDVPDPDGKDVQTFAAAWKAKLGGDFDDPNAKRWVEKVTAGKLGSVNGKWSSRLIGRAGAAKWLNGTATVRGVSDRVYILFEDGKDAYLIDAKRDGMRLAGRFINVSVPRDSGPWVGLIVNNQRIDGLWSKGRWDLRRRTGEGWGIVPSSLRASGSGGKEPPKRAFDGDPLTIWNSGAAAPGWIEMDLGAAQAIVSVAMLANHSDKLEGEVEHEVWLSDKPMGNNRGKPAVLVHTFKGKAIDDQQLRHVFKTRPSKRYVQIRTTKSPSWVSWREIEVRVE